MAIDALANAHLEQVKDSTNLIRSALADLAKFELPPVALVALDRIGRAADEIMDDVEFTVEALA